MKIKIKEPCDADWNKMKIGMISRHCELCVKNVMDFTKMSREEILIYLFKNNNKSTCARMYGGQMDFHHQELEAIIEGTRKQKGNLPFVVMSLAAMALLSCEGGKNSGFDPVMGEVVPTEMPQVIDSINQSRLDSLKQIKLDSIEQSITGGITKNHPTKQTCKPLRGEVEVEGMVDVVKGDIIGIPEPEPPKMGEMIEMPPEEYEIMGDMIAPSIPEVEIGKVINPIHQEKIYEVTEIMPEFIGGMDSLMSFLSQNIIYPKKVQKKGIEGRVFIQFIVEKDGEITNAEVLRGIKKSLDKEALRVISAMPNWMPGKNNGKEVRTKFVIPVKYQLK